MKRYLSENAQRPNFKLTVSQTRIANSSSLTKIQSRTLHSTIKSLNASIFLRLRFKATSTRLRHATLLLASKDVVKKISQVHASLTKPLMTG